LRWRKAQLLVETQQLCVAGAALAGVGKAPLGAACPHGGEWLVQRYYWRGAALPCRRLPNCCKHLKELAVLGCLYVLEVTMVRCLIALALVGFALPARAACPLPGEAPMLVVTLYFGESVPGRGPVTAGEWKRFAADVITPAFPDGFTVSDGEGQWRDPASGEIVREDSKVLTVAVAETPALAGKVKAVMDIYDKEFDQTSVGMTTEAACGAF